MRHEHVAGQRLVPLRLKEREILFAKFVGFHGGKRGMTQGDFVGIVQGVDSKTYIVRTGDKLSDGAVRAITADSMVILQQVNDPLSLEKVHEVRKVLRHTEEGK